MNTSALRSHCFSTKDNTKQSMLETARQNLVGLAERHSYTLHVSLYTISVMTPYLSLGALGGFVRFHFTTKLKHCCQKSLRKTETARTIYKR